MIPSKIQLLRRIELPQHKRKHTPTCISLFSGCGGMDIGFSQAGFEIRAMVEWEKASCDTLRANWTMEGHRNWIDRSIEKERLGENDTETIEELLRWRERGP